MTYRRKVLRRAARIAAGVFVAAGLVLLISVGVLESRRHEERTRRDRAREQRIAQAREYLAQLARRINRLPVDPAVPADIQSRYFEEQPRARLMVWATDAAGGFLFGVPAEEFARLNAAYDRHRQELDKDGFYPDRQAFLSRLLGHPEVDFSAVEGGGPEEHGWRRYRGGEHDWTHYSVPIKAADGSVLGTLYMKAAWEHDWGSQGGVSEVWVGAFGAVTVLSGLFLWFLLPTWVYVDARERGVPRAWLWCLLALISLFVGLIVYLIARPDEVKTLSCPGCGREVNGGGFCPHCGRDLSTAFCPACRYPLKPDWVFCPSCRTELRRQASPAAVGAQP